MTEDMTEGVDEMTISTVITKMNHQCSQCQGVIAIGSEAMYLHWGIDGLMEVRDFIHPQCFESAPDGESE